MAHFAELDSNNVVLRVVVVDNKDTADANGVEKEHIGAAFCERLFGGTWKQTSYNGTMTQPITTVHGSQQTCELAKAKLLKDMPKEYRLVASCIDR